MNPFPNPALPPLVNAANNVAYAIHQGCDPRRVAACVDELLRYWQAQVPA